MQKELILHTLKKMARNGIYFQNKQNAKLRHVGHIDTISS